MFPIRDSTPRQSFPFVNYALILLNVLVFVVELAAPNFDVFVDRYAFIPAQFSFFRIDSYFPIFTALFVHGGFLHIASNMWFLHIFGDNIEDRFGHLLYLFFYLAAGFIATMGQYVFTAGSPVPMIGASGAVSGVAGAYYVLFRHSKVETLVALFLVWTVIELPASFVLGYWFVTQLFAGLGSLATIDINQGGIAFFAHIGGFIFGYLVAKGTRSEGKTAT
ncbi:rhomboid family intramembrane serine protease [Candidatus Roizmanbacteria bacterium]|nr:rhomboid family intramembrane serine protease [Candidatus Roizmanbacteria bacterium]